MAKIQHCAKEEILVPAAQAGGIEEVLITQQDENVYVLSVKLLRTHKQIYLATRRNQNEPRTFKHADAAIGAARKLFGVKKLTVVLG